MRVRTHSHTHSLCAHTCIHTQMHTYTHTHTESVHTHTCTHTHTLSLSLSHTHTHTHTHQQLYTFQEQTVAGKESLITETSLTPGNLLCCLSISFSHTSEVAERSDPLQVPLHPSCQHVDSLLQKLECSCALSITRNLAQTVPIHPVLCHSRILSIIYICPFKTNCYDWRQLNP